jgi:hypothetical protein
MGKISDLVNKKRNLQKQTSFLYITDVGSNKYLVSEIN